MRREKKKTRGKGENTGERKENRPPKGNMWSAIPVVLLCKVLNWNERKQGNGPEGDKVL